MNISKIVRPHLVNFKGFEPADPLEVMAKRAGISAGDIIRLNANENPYGPSPQVAEALASITTNIYPDPQQRNARHAISEYTGLEYESILIGAGSDEIIDLLFRLIVESGDSVIECTPTFGMYGFGASLAGANCKSIPRDNKWNIDIPATLAAVDSSTKMILLNSPNNPTGNITPIEQVEQLLATGVLVVVDEAYYEFAGETVADLVNKHENLVVLRTMSKWAGIAGLRVGYGMMSPELVGYLLDIKQPYNVNTAGEAALLASLADSTYLIRNVDKIVAERERLFKMLDTIPNIKPWPSRGNYILCSFKVGKAEEIFSKFVRRGIFLRRFSHDRLQDCIRISVGKPSQTDALVAALNEIIV